MKLGKEDQRSPFAAALVRLLDDTKLMTRQQWADLLDVSPAAISQWVNDKTIPRPEVLRMIIDALEENPDLAPRVLREFKQISRLPAAEVSPNGDRMNPSIGHYVIKPLLEGFLRNLAGLDFEAQELILYHASDLCRQNPDQPAASRRGVFDRTPIDRPEGGNDSGEGDPVITGRQDDVTMSLASPPETFTLTDGATTEDDSEDEDIVTKTLVVNGEKQARLIRLIDRYQGLRIAARDGEASSGGHFEVVGKFFLDNEDGPSVLEEGQSNASCVVVLWSFRSGENLFDPFPLDEMMFFPLRGDFSWQYEGDVEAVRLSADSEHSDLMWMTAGKYRGPDRGLPPCRVVAGENAIGLGVFYSKHGVELRPAHGRFDSKDPRVELETMRWSQDTIREFWASLQASDRPPANRLPFVARVPCMAEELSGFVEQNKMEVNPDRKVKHDPARSRGQLSDARLPQWDDWKDAVLFPRIVKFHAWPPEKEGDICMDHHTGREIIVPLGGAFKCLYATLEPEDTELYELRSADLKDRIKRRYVRSAEVSGQDYSDILLLCSNSAHGFTGIEGDDSYCLHIACRAYLHGMQQPRRRKSESGDLRDRRLA
jgi:transcriptional regulator with XRE-family HTH domain